MRYFLAIALLITSLQAFAQKAPPYSGKFEAIDRLLEPPSPYRTASGAPGAEYWQQKADYKITAILDEKRDILSGQETITYYNNSPDDLKFLWIQLEQNVNKQENEDFGSLGGGLRDGMNSLNMQYLVRPIDFKAGTSVNTVIDSDGNDLKYIVNNTMMRVDLKQPLASKKSITFSITWQNHITDRAKFRLSREGYEYFPKDDNKVFLLGHWFPRMAVYNDTEGWQNKQFQRLGEFALEFGDYEIELTVPADHIVAGTGVLTNEKDVLTKKQISRLDKARSTFNRPVIIITPEEALQNERKKEKKTKTWKFKAQNVRDVAFASSRKFIWDAQAVKLETNTVMAMSFYPNEGLPTWSEESTLAVKNALEVYSEATFDYPYPVAISVNTSNIGMEFPMISFNGGRPVNGQMTDPAKNRMVGTIVHEVGHNWFPMIVSSDERKWMWMDEGLNTFLNERTMKEKYPEPQYTNFKPKDIIPYMKGSRTTMRPIMTNSDNDILTQMGSNFYRKPTAGLQVLRETIIGKELFDIAFKEYANRWKYKHPNPSDLFRTLEDGTAVDLDWFWKGWFFTTDNIDIELANVKWFTVKDESNEVEKKIKKGKSTKIAGSGSNGNNNDFSEGPQEINLKSTPAAGYGQFLSRLNETEVRKNLAGKNLYELTFNNLGGLVMPIIIEWTFADGTKEIERLSAEVWRHNEGQFKKAFLKNKEVVNIVIDPNQELPDVNTENNVFPKVNSASKFDSFKKSGNE